MNTATIPRIIFLTVAVLAGTVAILTDRFLPGITLIGFSRIVLMNKSGQKKHWSTPITRLQIVRGFIPLTMAVSFIAYLTVARESGSTPSETEMKSVSDVFKVVFVIALVFMIGRPWLRCTEAAMLQELRASLTEGVRNAKIALGTPNHDVHRGTEWHVYKWTIKPRSAVTLAVIRLELFLLCTFF